MLRPTARAEAPRRDAHAHRYFPGSSVLKSLPANAGDRGLVLGQEDPLGKEVATHSSVLAWEIPWTEETGQLQSTGSRRVGHD